MKVTVQLPEEMAAYLRAEIACGAAVDEADFLLNAVELYRELKSRHALLRASVQESLEEYERGEFRPLDTDATKAAARRRFSQER